MSLEIKPIYRHRWGELIVIALVISIISFLINVENPSGIVIITSLASTALGLMIAPGAATNSVRSVFLSYIIALFVSLAFGFLFAQYLDGLIEDTSVLFFIEFLIMLTVTLLLFGFLDAYHPPAIGAMLAYFINRGMNDIDLLIFVPMSVIFLLATIKAYIYFSNPKQFQWSHLPSEFRRPEKHEHG